MTSYTKKQPILMLPLEVPTNLLANFYQRCAINLFVIIIQKQYIFLYQDGPRGLAVFLCLDSDINVTTP